MEDRIAPGHSVLGLGRQSQRRPQGRRRLGLRHGHSPPTGTYTIFYAAGTSDGSALQKFNLLAEMVSSSDSIDPYLIDESTGLPTDTGLTDGFTDLYATVDLVVTWVQNFTFLLETDPYSDPFWY